MTIDFRKQSQILFFAAFLPALSIGIGWLFAQLVPRAPFWVETVSPLAAYGLLFSFFDKTAWHWPVFRRFGIVTVPDVRGRWVGEQISSYKNQQGKHIKSRVILEIDQTFSRIQAATYYAHWHSSISVAQFVDIGGTPTLLILFDAQPSAHYDGDATAHKGVTKLSQQPDKTLQGSYFNASGRHGELHFRRTRYTLHQTFEVVGSGNKN
jgi:hypothetical protein